MFARMDGALDDLADIESISQEVGEGADAEPDAATGLAGGESLAPRTNSFAVQVLCHRSTVS